MVTQEQECILVGCVLSAAAAVSQGRGHSQGCFPRGGGLLPGGVLCGGVLPGGCGIPSYTEADTPPHAQNYTQV